jgi:serine kinase of HPr protein (carbohydrate metabolism regulator)
MSMSPLSSETLHASCVSKDGMAILISGRSGSGKSDLALRLIDRGADLVSDDYTIVRRVGGKLLASAPENIRNKLEIRGLGILEFHAETDMPVCLMVELSAEVERMPEAPGSMAVAGVQVPSVRLSSLEASAPVKVEVALAQFGLDPET